ncbi:hypothetical protein Cs308_0309 [Candidatus Chlamydia sanziniae]|uniref:Uncharacterized protein n=1 Tax=Candidatus Chlamydia sanziniae TaxID=1806891 RepID=A0A1A9HU06_9CHLA|nr:hypothetical protein Cs308_0309 [Candidatus Chlamydia sanziniae]
MKKDSSSAGLKKSVHWGPDSSSDTDSGSEADSVLDGLKNLLSEISEGADASSKRIETVAKRIQERWNIFENRYPLEHRIVSLKTLVSGLEKTAKGQQNTSHAMRSPSPGLSQVSQLFSLLAWESNTNLNEGGPDDPLLTKVLAALLLEGPYLDKSVSFAAYLKERTNNFNLEEGSLARHGFVRDLLKFGGLMDNLRESHPEDVSHFWKNSARSLSRNISDHVSRLEKQHQNRYDSEGVNQQTSWNRRALGTLAKLSSPIYMNAMMIVIEDGLTIEE